MSSTFNQPPADDDRSAVLPGPVYAVVPAAGTGSRMQLPENKQFLMLGRYPVIIRTLRALEANQRIKGCLVVAAPPEVPAMRELIAASGLERCLGVAAGGATRQDSVANGLRALAVCGLDLADALVLVHDGARCFLPPDVIDRVIDGIIRHQACGAAVAVKDTIKLAGAGGLVEQTLDRARLWAMQTPQGASYRLLSQVYDQAAAQGWQATDDLALLEMAGQPVWLVPGDYRNIKLTTPEDRLLGEQLAWLADRGAAGAVDAAENRVIDSQGGVP